MKKTPVVSALILFAGVAVGQTLQKDNVFTLHVMEVNFKPGVTMDQFLEVVYEEYIPALNEAFPDVKGPVLKGIRGKHESILGFMGIYESEEILEKYWPESGVGSDLYKERIPLVYPAREKMAELADYDWATWTTWKVAPTVEVDTVATTIDNEMDMNLFAYPNPFSDHIMFEYELLQPESVRIEAYNSLGQLVATPFHGVQSPGYTSVHWNGSGNSGIALEEGVYNVRLLTGNSARTVGTIIKSSK